MTVIRGNRFFCKAFIFIFINIIFISLTACNDNKRTGLGTIQPAKLTTEEKGLINGVGTDKKFVFDFKLTSDKINALECWMEHYSHGQLKEKILNVETSVESPSQSKERIVFSTYPINTESGEEKWNIFCITGEGCAGGSSAVVQPDGYTATLSEENQKEQSIEENKPIALGAILKGRENSAMRIPPEIFDSQISSVSEPFQEDEDAYILYCRFGNN